MFGYCILCHISKYSVSFVRDAEWILPCFLDLPVVHTVTSTHSHWHTPHPGGAVVVSTQLPSDPPTHTHSHPRSSHICRATMAVVLTVLASFWGTTALFSPGLRNLIFPSAEGPRWRQCVRTQFGSLVTLACGDSFMAFLFPVNMHACLETVFSRVVRLFRITQFLWYYSSTILWIR